MRNTRKGGHTILRLAVLAGLILVLAGCYATLGKEADGNLAVNAKLPGVDVQPGDTYVARVYIATLDYEDLVRQFLAYEDFLDEYKDIVLNWSGYYNDLETERDNIEIDLALKGVVTFGGKPYVDVEIVKGIDNAGSFTITGIPAGKEYTGYIQVFNSGDEDDEDEDPVWDSELFSSSTTPYRDMFDPDDDENGTPEIGDPGYVSSTATPAVAEAAFETVLAAYRDTATYPVFSVAINEGETASLTLTLDLY